MAPFRLVEAPIDIGVESRQLADAASGAYVSFEGWVRNRNDGKVVERLEYHVYPPLVQREGQAVLAEARSRFDVREVRAIHRSGLLEIGECAVWVGVVAGHRDGAFRACRWIIDELKGRLPIWKREHYRDQAPAWVRCHHAHTRLE